MLVLAGPAAARVSRPSLASASAGIVVDARSGETLMSKHPDSRRPIASTTKLMTALLTLESGKLSRTFTAPAYNAAPAESKINLRRGERMTGRDLLTALLLESANDAAVDLAVGVAGSRERFVDEMNARARQLGLRHTHYANPVGLDAPGNYSSARDLATLARKLMTKPTFAETADRARATLRSGDHVRTIHNRNLLIGRYSFVDGVKTGHTSTAHYVLVGAAHGHGGKVISVVLGEPTEGARDVDTLALLRWGIDQYRRVTVLRPGRTVAYTKVAYHPDLRIRLTTRHSAAFTLRRGEHLTKRVHAPKELDGPIPAGRRVGSVEVLYLGHKVKTLALVTTRDVPGSTLVQRVTQTLGPPLTALALLLVVVGGVLAVRRLRASLARRPRTVS
ncbi:MAG TPA: D-alanyl-D-alanine carboxypeptidase family protein [Thermoleophilaceae bacterium]|nr:D-alanyl-D-alanine carboxypeptidase family protein [Thermoleophilaceae bacterium]